MAKVNLGFENKLWEMADKLRGNIESSEYKHVILGLVFLKYISDSFEERYNEVKQVYPGMEEDRDAYESENVFFVPKEARWDYIKSQAKQPTIGQVIDNAMILIERENVPLKNVLPKNYARPALDKTRLGELVDLFSFNVGSKEARAKDVLGRVYEYFLKKFGSTEGEFYTPPSIVKLLVNMIEPYKGRVYDPCCGSGGMFVQSAKFVEEHQGRLGDISIYGQEYVATTWRLAKMNLAIRGLDANLGERDGDTFTNDQHKTLKVDYILANPPFNIKDWGQPHLLDDVRWKWGVPPKTNANYAWISHMISKLSPRGTAGFVLANGSLSTSRSEEYDIRKSILEEGLVDCIVAMPSQLFYDVAIPVSLWFVSKNKNGRKDKVLFIDARKMGYMETRKHRELKDEEIEQIYTTYHNWKNEENYEDVDGFCKSSTIEEIKLHDYVLTPGRYVGIEEEEDDGIPFEEKMDRLTSELSDLFEESKSLEEKIKENLRGIGYEL
ncbi:type I restriction-modification system subunit M [Candidatus Xianfuyuplasma coldseepsis]|uniref:site-specific DNA-methyltransferase (adenine-specific) n=1 Tax=Candidatus Xianfuyuplasma coldseepsis TaxID=2782163 RepID=A0A7L7KQX6_9MOLU|nr:class I SAM-dependent DNA methyltransferase [Xianfuyuplasma coldseepsis]QMS84839.1 SAM-dependent DNA methyltransferase [Xianfuyuplasma coldseepsis]